MRGGTKARQNPAGAQPDAAKRETLPRGWLRGYTGKDRHRSWTVPFAGDRVADRHLTPDPTSPAAASSQNCVRSAARPGCSPPEPRSGRVRARLFGLLPVLALLFGALSPFAAAPAAADVLASNINQRHTFLAQANSDAFAQAFTTGNAGGSGYVLDSIEVGRFLWRSLTSQELAYVKGELWSSRSNGEPGSKIADLTPAASLGVDDSNQPFAPFAAPAGTRLDGNTTYYFVTYTTRTMVDSDNDPAYNIRLTASNDVDPETETLSGWSIAGHCLVVANGNAAPTASSWGARCIQDTSLRVRVNGSVAANAVSGTMTVGDGGSWKGFQATPSIGQLPGAGFTYGGVRYRILGLRLTNSGGYLDLHLDKDVDRDRKWGLVLNVGGSEFKLADAVLSTGPGYEGVIAGWAYSNLNGSPNPPSWSVGDTVAVSLGVPTSTTLPTVKLSVRPTVKEGSWVSVEACLSALPQQSGTMRIPVTLSHGSSETGDWGVSRSGQTDGSLPVHTAYSIAISGLSGKPACGVVGIPTHWDDDRDDETFTVALDRANLPPGVLPGTPSKGVTILDQVENARLRDLEMNTGN